MANETKLDFQRKIKEFQAWHEIPEDLIVNFDQTNLPYTCIGKRTYHKQGSSNVPLVGKGKKKQITGSFAVTMTGQFLPMQLIVVFQKGVEFPDDWYVPYTKNHWTNEEKAIEHIEKVVFPYLKKQKAELKLTDEQKGMLNFDVFIGQVTVNVTKIYRAERLCACTCTKQHDPPLSTTRKSP